MAASKKGRRKRTEPSEKWGKSCLREKSGDEAKILVERGREDGEMVLFWATTNEFKKK